MLHRLCGSPSIPLSFTLACVLPRRITYRVSLGAEVRPPTPSDHRLRRGLPGYLILFVCFPVTAIAAVLSRSPMTVKRSLNELETAGLIMRVRQGVGEPNRIYVLIPGIEGGAYATAIGQVLSAVYLCMHFPKSTFRLSFDIKDIQWNLMGKICSLGFSSFILEFAVMVITILLNITLSRTEGQIGVAAYGIISYSFVIYRMLFTGLAQGIQPLVSFIYRRRN